MDEKSASHLELPDGEDKDPQVYPNSSNVSIFSEENIFLALIGLLGSLTLWKVFFRISRGLPVIFPADKDALGCLRCTSATALQGSYFRIADRTNAATGEKSIGPTHRVCIIGVNMTSKAMEALERECSSFFNIGSSEKFISLEFKQIMFFEDYSAESVDALERNVEKAACYAYQKLISNRLRKKESLLHTKYCVLYAQSGFSLGTEHGSPKGSSDIFNPEQRSSGSRELNPLELEENFYSSPGSFDGCIFDRFQAVAWTIDGVSAAVLTQGTQGKLIIPERLLLHGKRRSRPSIDPSLGWDAESNFEEMLTSFCELRSFFLQGMKGDLIRPSEESRGSTLGLNTGSQVNEEIDYPLLFRRMCTTIAFAREAPSETNVLFNHHSLFASIRGMLPAARKKLCTGDFYSYRGYFCCVIEHPLNETTPPPPALRPASWCGQSNQFFIQAFFLDSRKNMKGNPNPQEWSIIEACHAAHVLAVEMSASSYPSSILHLLMAHSAELFTQNAFPQWVPSFLQGVHSQSVPLQHAVPLHYIAEINGIHLLSLKTGIV